MINSPCLILSELACYLTGQMYNMTEFLHDHEFINLDRRRLAHAIDIVSGQVDEHYVFSSVFLRVEQLLAQPFIFCSHARHKPPILGQLCTHLLSFCPVSQYPQSRDCTLCFPLLCRGFPGLLRPAGALRNKKEHVWARVNLPQLPVGVKGVQLRLLRKSLARHCLNDIAGNDMVFQVCYEGFIPLFPDV